MNWKLVIFDLDGTLIDTIEDLGLAVNFALESKGLPTHQIQEYRQMVGGGVRNLVWKAMPEQSKDDEKLLDELLAVFMQYYKANICVHSHPYDGIPELLSELDSATVKLAVASNKFQSGAQELISMLFPDIDFLCVYGGREGVALKPDPSIVNTIIREAQLDTAEVVMVGDSGTDTRTAAAAGIDSIAVSWGFKPESAAEGATYIAHSCEELRSVLLD